MGKRTDVLKAVHAILVNDAKLVELTGHNVNADSLAGGARILGDDVRIESLPVPGIVLGFDAGESLNPSREEKTWQLDVLAFGSDVFQAADLLDAVEDIGTAWKQAPGVTEPLIQFSVGPHQRFDAEGPNGRTAIGVRITITARWIQR